MEVQTFKDGDNVTKETSPEFFDTKEKANIKNIFLVFFFKVKVLKSLSKECKVKILAQHSKAP